MVNDDNPYEPPMASPAKAAHVTIVATRGIDWMQAIFFVHLAALIASAFVVRSDTILSNHLLQTLIALPLFFTMTLFPIVMLMAAIASTRQKTILRVLAVLGDIALSALQMFVWLPTVQ